MSSEITEATAPDEAVVMPLYLCPRPGFLVVRDAHHHRVAILKHDNTVSFAIRRIVSNELSDAVRGYAAAMRRRMELSAVIGCEQRWDVIIEEVEELLHDRERMQRTIGELRGMVRCRRPTPLRPRQASAAYRCPVCGDDMGEISSSGLLSEYECQTCEALLHVDHDNEDAAHAD